MTKTYYAQVTNDAIEKTCELGDFESKQERDNFVNDVNNASNTAQAEAISSKDARLNHKEWFRHWRYN